MFIRAELSLLKKNSENYYYYSYYWLHQTSDLDPIQLMDGLLQCPS